MEEFNVIELQVEHCQRRIKLLEEVHQLMNDEINILTKMIEMTIPEDDYFKIRAKAVMKLLDKEEDE